MAKIKCSNCGFTINAEVETCETDVKCPLCKQVIPVNVEKKTMKTFIENAVNPKTHKSIIMLLTYIYSLGLGLLMLNFLIEYRPTPEGGRYRMSLRQLIIMLMVYITGSFILDSPFNKSFNKSSKLNRKERMSRINETRRTAFLHYFTYMCIYILVGYLFLDKYVLLDLTQFYSVRKKEYLIENNYVFYVITYIASILCLYVPYLIYYGFKLNFEYLDTKRYFRIFTIINDIFVFSVFLIYKF